jgi:CBS domain-containing protein
MRRVNVQAAFLGEGGESSEGDEEGLALAVRGGEVILVVPAGTPDERAVSAASCVRGSLRLESGRVLLFEIQEGAVGAFFEDEPAALFDRREEAPEEGLSSFSAGSVGRPTFGGAAALQGAAAAARDVMTRSVVSVTPEQTVDEVARLLTFHHISGAPVCHGDQMVGVVSEADLIGKYGTRVEQVMSSPPVTVPETLRLEEVATQLLQRRLRRVPVVDGQGRLVGIVSRSDILRWAVRQTQDSSA